MFCTKCGNKLEDGARFCPACGAQTESPAEQMQQQAGQAVSNAGEAAQQQYSQAQETVQQQYAQAQQQYAQTRDNIQQQFAQYQQQFTQPQQPQQPQYADPQQFAQQGQEAVYGAAQQVYGQPQQGYYDQGQQQYAQPQNQYSDPQQVQQGYYNPYMPQQPKKSFFKRPAGIITLAAIAVAVIAVAVVLIVVLGGGSGGGSATGVAETYVKSEATRDIGLALKVMPDYRIPVAAKALGLGENATRGDIEKYYNEQMNAQLEAYKDLNPEYYEEFMNKKNTKVRIISSEITEELYSGDDGFDSRVSSYVSRYGDYGLKKGDITGFATVKVTYEIDGDEDYDRIDCIKIGGSWFVDD